MQEQLKLIGARIAELRDIFGLDTAEVARSLGIGPDEYASYEAGETDIPVSALYSLSHLFKVELTTLLTGEEPRMHSYSLTRRGTGTSVERRSSYAYEALATNFIHKKAEPFIVTVTPKDAVHAELNAHPGQEFNYVLEGTLVVTLGATELTLNSGDSLYFNSSVPHAMRATGETPARFLALIL